MKQNSVKQYCNKKLVQSKKPLFTRANSNHFLDEHRVYSGLVFNNISGSSSMVQALLLTVLGLDVVITQNCWKV